MLLFALALLPAVPGHMDTLERGPASLMSYKLHNWGTQYNDGKSSKCAPASMFFKKPLPDPSSLLRKTTGQSLWNNLYT